MSVFYEDQNHGTNNERRLEGGRWRAALQALRSNEGRGDRELAYDGRTFERVEGLIHLSLAFAIVAGAAILLKTAFMPEPAHERLIEPRAAGPAPAALAQKAAPPRMSTVQQAPVEALETKPADLKVAVTGLADEAAAPVAEPPAQVAAPQVAAAPSPAAGDHFQSPQPIAQSAQLATPASPLEPLAPPPPDLREKLAARTVTPERIATPVPQEVPAVPQDAMAHEAAPQAGQGRAAESAPAREAADRGRVEKCYFKLSGHVQNSGPCRVTHTGNAVVFQLPGKPLEIAQNHGRVWTATLGGRSLGKVYKTGACWGAKGFYACENG